MDPSGVLHGYRRKSAELGAEYRHGAVERLVRDGDRIRGVVLDDGEEIVAETVLVAAGAWSSGLLGAIQVEVPVDPVMRNVFVVDTPLTDPVPAVFLPSGVYALPEHGGSFLMGWSQPDDPVGFDFSVRRSRFYDRIWPELIEHLPSFDRLEVSRSWAGLYAVNRMDGNAILGEWPDVRGLHICTGFSGHGFQQCHGVGRYMAETILGRDPAIDLSRLGPERVLRGEPLFEHEGRLI